MPVVMMVMMMIVSGHRVADVLAVAAGQAVKVVVLIWDEAADADAAAAAAHRHRRR